MSDDERGDERHQLFEKIRRHIAILKSEPAAADPREAIVYIDSACDRIRFLCERYCDLDTGGV